MALSLVPGVSVARIARQHGVGCINKERYAGVNAPGRLVLRRMQFGRTSKKLDHQIEQLQGDEAEAAREMPAADQYGKWK